MQEILDDCLKRSNVLGSWKCPEVRHLSYWEVRYILPKLIVKGLDSFIDYFVETFDVERKFTDEQSLSFFYYILDELRAIREDEDRHITFNSLQGQSVIHSQRARSQPELMELGQMADGCPFKMEQIKNLKYSAVFESLLYKSLDSEKIIKKQ